MSNKKKNSISNKLLSNDPKEMALALKEEGNKLFSEDKFNKAIDYYTKAIELDDKNPIFYSNRSASYLSKGEYNLGLKDALKCLEIDSNYAKAYYRAALGYLYKNEYEKALEIIEKCKLENKEKELEILKEMVVNKMKEEENNKQNFPSYERFKQFFEWLNEGKVYYPKLELKFFSDDHRGIVAKNKIQKDEIIVKIPMNMLITLEMAKESPIGIKMLNANLDLLSPKHCFLSVFLLQEKIKDISNWTKYLEILPKNYDNFPIFFTEEENKFLKGSPFLELIKDKINDIQSDYSMIAEVAPEFQQNFSSKEFSEMRMAVSSRIFGIKVTGRKTDCFAPLADMLNHRRPRQTQWLYSDDLKSFVIQSLCDIQIGEQVYDSYGKKCNSRFLLNYGFTVENNDGNEFPLTIELTNKHPLYSYKTNFTKELKKTFKVTTNFEDQVNLEFISFLRFVTYEGDSNSLINLMILKKGGENKSYNNAETINDFPIVDITNELSVLKEIERLTEYHLSLYETDLETDLNILEKDINLTMNQRNCLIMIIGEKNILTFYQNFAKYAQDLFKLNSKEIKKKIKKDFPNLCLFESYVNNVVLQLIRIESSK